MAHISVSGLTAGYDRLPAIVGIDGAFAPGQATAVMGPNGSGKSTLLKALAGLIKPQAGRVIQDGAARGDLAYLPQDSGADRDFPIDVADFVSLGFIPRRGLFKPVGARQRDQLAQAIAAVGLQGLERRPIGALSGGQFRRAQFARVIVQDAAIVLLDEPFNALDTRSTHDLCALTRDWTAQGRTTIMVLHDLDQARALCRQALVLARRCVAWGETGAVLTPEVLARAEALAGEAA